MSTLLAYQRCCAPRAHNGEAEPALLSAAVTIERAWRRRPWRQVLMRWRWCKRLQGNVQLHNPLDPTHASLLLVLQRPTPPGATAAERLRDCFFRRLTRLDRLAALYTYLSLVLMVEFKVVTLWLGPFHPVSDVSNRVLMWIFAYNFVVSSPWRLANLHHLYCSPHSHAAGLDYYGRETRALWFFIAPSTRRAVTVLNLLSTAGGVATLLLVSGTPLTQKRADVGGYQARRSPSPYPHPRPPHSHNRRPPSAPVQPQFTLSPSSQHQLHPEPKAEPESEPFLPSLSLSLPLTPPPLSPDADEHDSRGGVWRSTCCGLDRGSSAHCCPPSPLRTQPVYPLNSA